MLKTLCLIAMMSIGFTAVADAQIRRCNMYMNFESPAETRLWRAVNDGVMGGLSSGGPSFEAGNMVFQGIINTNGGGFSSLRSPVQDKALAGASGMKLRVRSDGRAYKLTFRTDSTWRGRRISFQAPIPETPIGQWTEVTVPFSQLRGTIFGRAVRGAQFDRTSVNEMGIILADGQDGAFRLEVDWMAECIA